MKANKYREKTADELRIEAGTLREKLLRLRFQAATGNVENPLKKRTVRRDLARVLTILTEKENGEASST